MNSFNRNNASKIITKAIENSKLGTIILEVGEKFYSLDNDMTDYKKLRDNGYIDFEQISRRWYLAKITDKIKPYIEKYGEVEKRSSIGGSYYSAEHEIVIYKRKFVEVTGITKSDSQIYDCDQIAEFTYSIDITQIGLLLDPSLQKDIVKTNAACFKLYDNGWRMTGFFKKLY
jgi:hypothetical protein